MHTADCGTTTHAETVPAVTGAPTSARWAALALLLFAAGATAHLLGAPPALWWALYLACYATGGWESARDGVLALRERRLDVDVLMIVAAIGAAAIGQIFDGALLIVIFATSGALEDIATKRTADSVDRLLNLAPDNAVRVDPGGLDVVVPAADLRVGDRVVVRPGERISADGFVASGISDVDQASITGEPMPVLKSVGDEVFAGTLNGSGVLHLVVAREPSQTVIARIVTQVAAASATKATTQLFIEKVEQRYSIGVVAATLALFTIPLLLGDGLETTLLRAMTFMIVASPCALVLATMPPLLSAIANAGRHGVLVKSAVAMEHLADADLVALDKTGTLTDGTPVLTSVVPLGGFDADRLLQFASGAERYSEHPLGRAIVAAARGRGLTVPRAADFAALPGRGVRATVLGAEVAVNAPTGAEHPRVRELERTGATVVIVTVNQCTAGILGLTDRLRVDAALAVDALTRLTGTSAVLLTGDNPEAAAHVAAQVGIEHVRAGLLPEEKAGAVAELQHAGHRALMIGDGVNDAPAMAVAHASIAMGRSGADLSIETADAVSVRDELTAVAAVIALARRARRVVIANLAIAATVVAALVAWDLIGELPLPLGVAGHEGSTILVALNGLRLLTDRAWRRAAR